MHIAQQKQIIPVEITEDLLASKGKRFVNHLIDLVPQYAVIYGLSYGFYYLGEFTGNYALSDWFNGMSTVMDYVFTYLLLLIYYTLMEGYTERTLGKYVTRTKVIKIDAEPITLKDAFIRSLCRLIPFDMLSFLGTNGKGWHDSISKTYVVDIDKFESKKQTEINLEAIGNTLIE
ncbi:RDD family protein [Gaetbulibacter sp. PBL-D1]|uniref:RDD family protein n=1 Tax=Gaetbulibacter sp. PBL-D1 TaxID=3422594 RepID=UPI003D2EA692